MPYAVINREKPDRVVCRMEAESFLSHSRGITVENLMFINPPHYTVYLGDSEDVEIRNIKSFSCEGWSDGIDMMSCRNILVDGGFLRTSDDCVAIYGSRWDNRGDSRNITVRNLSVWADVAHPLMIGTHGAHGKVLDIQVKWNRDYNPAPGKLITEVRFERIHVMSGSGEEASCVCGYDEENRVGDVCIDSFYRDGVRAETLEQANIQVGEFVRKVEFCAAV